MIKIRTIKEFEESIIEGKIPSIIANQVYGDLLMFKDFLVEEYEHNDKSAIVIIDKNEFSMLAMEYKIDLDEYEYKDVIGVNTKYYIEKLLYIKNNGDTGIIVYKVNHFGKTLEKFNNEIYMTKAINEKIPVELLNMLRMIIEETRIELLGKLDYLQVFNIKNIGKNNLKIDYLQEIPNHSKVYYIPNMKCEDCKIYWISETYEDKEYSTILFAEEY